ncbi:unnamed protein product [Chrysoparadoxa australica]
MAGDQVAAGCHKCLILVSSLQHSAQQEAEQRRCRDLMNAMGLEFEEMDCADDTNTEKRDFLFGLSERKSVYPQIFLEGEQGCKFVGMWSDIEQLIEMNDLPPDFLSKHPEIKTFDQVFKGVSRGMPTHNLPSVW